MVKGHVVYVVPNSNWVIFKIKKEFSLKKLNQKGDVLATLFSIAVAALAGLGVGKTVDLTLNGTTALNVSTTGPVSVYAEFTPTPGV